MPRLVFMDGPSVIWNPSSAAAFWVRAAHAWRSASPRRANRSGFVVGVRRRRCLGSPVQISAHARQIAPVSSSRAMSARSARLTGPSRCTPIFATATARLSDAASSGAQRGVEGVVIDVMGEAVPQRQRPVGASHSSTNRTSACSRSSRSSRSSMSSSGRSRTPTGGRVESNPARWRRRAAAGHRRRARPASAARGCAPTPASRARATRDLRSLSNVRPAAGRSAAGADREAGPRRRWVPPRSRCRIAPANPPGTRGRGTAARDIALIAPSSRSPA